MRTDLPYIAHNDHTCGGNREKRSQAFAPLPAPAFDPSGPPWSLCGYSSLDRCPRCDQCMAVPDPGWAEPACTIAGCGQGTAEPSLDPTVHRSSLKAHHVGFEQWLAELCEGISARGHLVDIGAPVSYTHLDVYKRQPLLRALQPGGSGLERLSDST